MGADTVREEDMEGIIDVKREERNKIGSSGSGCSLLLFFRNYVFYLTYIIENDNIIIFDNK